MKLQLCGRVAICVLLSAAMGSAASAQTCKSNAKDEAAVVETMRTMYAAASTDDLAKFHSVIAPSFYGFDGGVRYDGDALMRMVIDFHAKGYRFVWTVTHPEVHVHCDAAWIAYVNDGSVQQGDAAATPMQWLESAELERVSGAWKIVFFHSTRVPSGATK